MSTSARRIATWLIVMAAVIGIGIAVVMSGAAEPVASEQPSATPTPAPAPTRTLTAEEQAEADLDKLVREYYAAENERFLDSALSPTDLYQYLSGAASDHRISTILQFRDEGHTFSSRTSTIHTVTLRSLGDVDGKPLAVMDVCHSVAGEGRDGITGEIESVSKRGNTEWEATKIIDGTWRLFSFDSPAGSSC